MFKQIDIESLVGPVVAQVAEKLGGSRIGKKFLYPSCLRVHFSMLFLPRLLEHSGPQTAFRFMDWAQTPPSPRLVRAFVLFFLRRQPCEIWNAVAAINYFRTHYGYRCDAKYDKQLAFKPLYNAARERQLDVRVLKVLYRESFWRDRDGVVRCAVKKSRLDRAVAEPLSESDRAWAQDVMDICWPVDQAGSPLKTEVIRRTWCRHVLPVPLAETTPAETSNDGQHKAVDPEHTPAAGVCLDAAKLQSATAGGLSRGLS
ncbi:hypothetical protein KL948_004138 [Ogataea haglerorum]|nr:hypothetical protein KL948_004138 [Ogataea haglerorum]KAG7736721.1 hypothetical protein KL923_004304 [Ogataea haglerorum]KAG7786279.1 hypothetical protein KL945_003505 [Ogataea haglerorum]KAG7786465.1 hypothetical protein KL910_004312 [Ogataea haglerorum]